MSVTRKLGKMETERSWEFTGLVYANKEFWVYQEMLSQKIYKRIEEDTLDYYNLKPLKTQAQLSTPMCTHRKIVIQPPNTHTQRTSLTIFCL